MSSTEPPSNSALPAKIPGTLPLGYRLVDNRIEVDPVWAKRIVSLFRQYVERR
jgi:hypothetical protein